eukprot:scaffold128705_cov60-Phaeocystis_antarctica.AAC.1
MHCSRLLQFCCPVVLSVGLKMRVSARVVLTVTTAILSLPPAAHAVCPTGWTPSPASATCFLVPPERSTSVG